MGNQGAIVSSLAVNSRSIAGVAHAVTATIATESGLLPGPRGDAMRDP